jgi:serine/threonine protein kinase
MEGMPDVVGQYVLTNVLGGGGMATVYRGEHVSGIGMTAAIKKLHAHLAVDDRIRKRLRVEAQALVRLQHPNIVRIIDFVESTEACALVTELVEGRTLRAVMEDAGRPMPLVEAVLLMRQMLVAVGHAHRQQCLHRDIKPGNVMVTPDGQVKVLDFGIASLLDRDRLTGTGVSLGTPVYMAPEQVEGVSDLDERADIYALGVTLWEMLAGPNARPIGAAGWRLRPEHMAKLREVSTPRSVIEVVQAMVEEDRERRLRTCSEVAQALAWAVEEARSEPSPALEDSSTVDDSGERTLPMTRPPALDGLQPGLGLARSIPALQGISTTAVTASPVAHLVDGNERTVPMDRAALTGSSVESTAPFLRTEAPVQEQAAASLELDPSEHEGWPVPEATAEPATLHPVGPAPAASPSRRRQGRRARSRASLVALLAGVLVLGLGAVTVAGVVRSPSRGTRGSEADLLALRALPGVVVFPRGQFPYGAEARTTGLSAFALQRTEVSVADWRRCVEAGGCDPEVIGRYGRGGASGTAVREGDPVEWVAWKEAGSYCRWAFAERALPQGFVGRLPTDAEWERAARGVEAPGRRYPTGEELPSGLGNVGQVMPSAPGSSPGDRTPDGVMDMVGGVEEWVWDGRTGSILEEHTDVRPSGDRRTDPVMRPQGSPEVRALRGGHYGMNPAIDPHPFRSVARAWAAPAQSGIQRGFRCAVGREIPP